MIDQKCIFISWQMMSFWSRTWLMKPFSNRTLDNNKPLFRVVENLFWYFGQQILDVAIHYAARAGVIRPIVIAFGTFHNLLRIRLGRTEFESEHINVDCEGVLQKNHLPCPRRNITEKCSGRFFQE